LPPIRLCGKNRSYDVSRFKGLTVLTVQVLHVYMVAMVALMLALGPAGAGMAPASVAVPDFQQWLGGLKSQALTTGVSEGTLDRALARAALIDRVIELDRQQPEFTRTFWSYLNRRVTPERIRRGQEELARNMPLLNLVSLHFGVQPRFLVALWALESNFGDDTGDFNAVSALATLAFDTRRGEFFRKELLTLLKTMDQGDIHIDANSSWAGAMGQPQFMPTTYQGYAVDFDGNGRRDLWGSLADLFGSAANYLKSAGWQANQTWGREVLLPPDFDYALAELDIRKPVSEWARLGVRDARGRPLPDPAVDASIILPGGVYGAPAFMVYPNFRAIMVWNRSILYAIAVGHLADRLAGEGAFVSPPPAREEPLSMAQVKEIQSLLAGNGFDAGKPDGVVGPQTRQADRAYQKAARLPADGCPTLAILENLRLSARN
jgi:membrane-bound lytic murein transglycosylase B